MADKKRERERGGKHAHRWVDDTCAVCTLRRRETWVLSQDKRAVMALVWSGPGGEPVRVLEFAYFKGMKPPVTPTHTLAEEFPGLRVGREPKCPGEPSPWTSAAAESVD